MRLRLPALKRTPLPSSRAELLGALRALSQNPPSEGFLQVSRRGGESLLFLHRGRPHSAGALEDGRFVSLALSDFAGTLTGVEEASLSHADLPLFLCAAVMFRKAPAAHVPLSLVDSEALLRNIRDMGKDAVLVVQRGEARSLVFCREGEPAVLYPGRGEPFPERGAIADRIIEYVYQSPDGPAVTMDLYDDIQLSPARGAGQPLAHYLERTAAAETPYASLVVRLGERVVFRFPLQQDEVLIGRGDGIDVVLDNVSVSRRHARVTRSGDKLRIEDLGSENGLVVRGERVPVALLSPGEEVGIGKYTLGYARYASRGDELLPDPPRRAFSAGAETVAIPLAHAVTLEHEGTAHRMKGALFSIGASDEANLRVGGFFIAPTHLAILRDSAGYRARHVGGLRKVRVNGEVVRESRLKDGDVIRVGRARVVFRAPEHEA